MYDTNSVQGVVGRIVTDSPVAIRLTVNSDYAKSLTSAVVAVGGPTITLNYVDKDDANQELVIDLSTYDTIGKVVDFINKKPNVINARILDSLRSSDPLLLLDGTYTADTSGNVSMVWDTSNLKQFVYRICANKEFDSQPLNPFHRTVKFISANYKVVLGAAGAGNFQVYRTRYYGYTEDFVEQVLYSAPSVSNTDTTISFGDEAFISGNIGDELVVILKDATSIADLAANYLEVRSIIC